VSSIASSWGELRRRVGESCASLGRDAAAVRIIAVSKVQPVTLIREAVEAGITDFGENRIQEAEQKIPAIGPGPTWHLVGHLQTNKARRAARIFDWVQSVDSARVAMALGRGAEAAGRDLGVLVQVNTTAEGQKSGCEPDELGDVIGAVTSQRRLKLAGIMTIGPLSMEEAPTRRAFRKAADLREAWRVRLPEGSMEVLSMGMSGDWPWALEHGADWIRVGTAIFGRRPA
jgi:pyridoxal phosphate enzyme (YggS family)